MKYFGAPQTFRSVADSVGFPHFVADLLNSLYDANLDIQTMDQTGTKLTAAGFAALAQAIGAYQPGDVAVSGSGIAIFDGRAWVASVDPYHLRPPYRVYRRRQLLRR